MHRSRTMLKLALSQPCKLMLLHFAGYCASHRLQAALTGLHWKIDTSSNDMRYPTFAAIKTQTQYLKRFLWENSEVEEQDGNLCKWQRAEICQFAPEEEL
jgi:hypothetical protein